MQYIHKRRRTLVPLNPALWLVLIDISADSLYFLFLNIAFTESTLVFYECVYVIFPILNQIQQSCHQIKCWYCTILKNSISLRSENFLEHSFINSKKGKAHVTQHKVWSPSISLTFTPLLFASLNKGYTASCIGIEYWFAVEAFNINMIPTGLDCNITRLWDGSFHEHEEKPEPNFYLQLLNPTRLSLTHTAIFFFSDLGQTRMWSHESNYTTVHHNWNTNSTWHYIFKSKRSH